MIKLKNKLLTIIFFTFLTCLNVQAAVEINYDCKFPQNPERNFVYKINRPLAELLEVNGQKLLPHPKEYAKKGNLIDMGVGSIDTYLLFDKKPNFIEIESFTKEIKIYYFEEFTKEEFLKIRENTLRLVERNQRSKVPAYEGVIKDMKKNALKHYPNKLTKTIKGQCQFI